MNKLLFDVFPTLKVNNDLKILFQDVEVTKVATNSSREFIRVHIFSRHLIQKKHIFALEKLIKEQMFATIKIKIEVVEKYQLSEQYTPENLLNEYFESLLLELDERSVVERNMLQNATYFFEDENILCLKFVDSIVAQGKKDSLADYLKMVFADRFDRPVEVRALYESAKESKLKYNEVKLQQEVDAILAHAKTVQEEKKEAQEEKKAEKKPEKKFEKKFERKFEKKDPDGDANLIYGRDFNDETIELSQVVTEMGEITIRGKIISFDTREIRNEKTIIMFAVTDFTDTIMV